MKILTNRAVQELEGVLEESRDIIESQNLLLKRAAERIAMLEDALLTEKRCHMAVAAGASQAIADGIDLREELDEIAIALQADVARLEEWFVSDE